MFSGTYMFLDNLTAEHNDLLETIGLPLMKTLTRQRTEQMAKVPLNSLQENCTSDDCLYSRGGKMLHCWFQIYHYKACPRYSEGALTRNHVLHPQQKEFVWVYSLLDFETLLN